MQAIAPSSAASASLGAKLLAAFLGIGIVPSVAVGWIAYARGRDDLIERAGASLAFAARSVGDKIDRNLFERSGDVQAFAFNPLASGTPEEVARAAGSCRRASRR